MTIPSLYPPDKQDIGKVCLFLDGHKWLQFRPGQFGLEVVFLHTQWII